MDVLIETWYVNIFIVHNIMLYLLYMYYVLYNLK